LICASHRRLAGPSLPGRITRAQTTTVIAATVGAVVEWFDLLVYAMFAVVLAKQFFPTTDPSVSLPLLAASFAFVINTMPMPDQVAIWGWLAVSVRPADRPRGVVYSRAGGGNAGVPDDADGRSRRGRRR
jgi:hypothetical protein